MKVLGLGWDVGGWMGRKNAVAAVRWSPRGGLQWLGPPVTFRIPRASGSDYPLTPARLLRLATSEDVSLDAFDRIAIAVDAPLGYPADYQALVQGKRVRRSELASPSKEIESHFAYRATERYIFDEFQKKPLSAPFDKLGNNATVAIAHARAWRARKFALVPQDDKPRARRVIFEVYPALVKSPSRRGRNPKAQARFHRLLYPGLRSGTDEYDAAICAVLAVAFYAGGRGGLPPLEKPPRSQSKLAAKEGWIYYVSPSWLSAA